MGVCINGPKYTMYDWDTSRAPPAPPKDGGKWPPPDMSQVESEDVAGLVVAVT